MSVNIYTAKYNEKAFASSVTDTEAGSDKNNLFDQNMNTFWQADDATGTQKEIVIDTQVTPTVINRIGMWISNYTSLGFGLDVSIYESDNGTDWGSVIDTWDFIPGSGIVVGSGYLIMFDELASALTKRYVKITLTGMAVAPKIGQILLLTKRTLDRGPEYPISDLPQYFNVKTVMQDGRQIVKPLSQNPITKYSRSYRLLNSTMKTVWDNIIADLKEGQNLFVFNPTFGYFILCRLTGYNYSEVAYQFYEPVTLEFQSIPYITEGEYF